jgi:MoaA/NifB/PqqE/SkfB family radical SAM enzyme
MRCFAQRLKENGKELRRRKIDILQVNMAKYCNQACIHCHVEAGPTRKEMMRRETAEAVVALFSS